MAMTAIWGLRFATHLIIRNRGTGEDLRIPRRVSSGVALYRVWPADFSDVRDGLKASLGDVWFDLGREGTGPA